MWWLRERGISEEASILLCSVFGIVCHIYFKKGTQELFSEDSSEVRTYHGVKLNVYQVECEQVRKERSWLVKFKH